MAAGRPPLERLSPGNAAKLPPTVARPGYDRDATGTGIVHLGVGAFMRAHVATYCDEAMAADGGDWRIAGVSLRSADVRRQLAPQDCLYTLCVQDGDACERRLVGALSSLRVAPENPAAITALIANPATRVVTLTVTEKGYCLDAGSGTLDLAHPGIAADLAAPERPATTIGHLVAGLKARYENGRQPLTIVSCDNLPGNGRRLQDAVLAFAAAVDADVNYWIADAIAFPATMVDRIVPATTPEDLVAGEAALDVHDAALVKTEPFSQWVLEDRFAAARPAWEAGGALFVPDVEPYESAKLRLLNGAHSTIAYLGYLAGYRYVHEVLADPGFRRFVDYLMRREISPVTPEPAGMEHEAYVAALLARFANPALGHRTWQIAMDGSQKLPQRLLRTIELQLDAGGPVDGLCLAVAAWMRYVLGRDDAGAAIEVSDPLAERFAAIAAVTGEDARDRVAAFLGIREIFGKRLPAEARFRDALASSLEAIAAQGAAMTVRNFAAGRITDGH